ncbi:ATP-binding protein [Cryomorpha ignava]|uniref:ATP-binding protein n=1 Tax=Cryomorpha ignava TaxID=101383 RepID=A0A7K3WSA4_9FLAO|nr:AAA family ATPase [Cryomorpha ignava]NEN24570.1 ATP-binding protein [Cryomorpha ignava]
MEKLIERFAIRLRNTSLSFKRYLLHSIDWGDRLIAIKGARGVGKTTLILQHIKENFKIDATVLYVSLDDIYFQAHSLVDLAEEFYKNGGKHLFIDEVHKYSNWSLELKNIYDNYQDLKVVFTGSSMLEIYKGDADLSRRAVSYELKGLSFREYLTFEKKADLAPLDLSDILVNHHQIATEITAELKILPEFKQYLKMGYYPFYKEGKNSYHQKLNNIVNLILETDVTSVYRAEYQTILKLKKLLYVIATSVPFQPNITKLSEKIDTTSRSSTLQYLDYLEKANLIINLKTSAKGNNYLVKPDKIYLENTNLMVALGDQANEEGNIRETFFLNQLSGANQVNTSKISDFLVNNQYTFEVGGKNKGKSQIKGLDDAFLASDNIEIGFGNKIPIWLFGLLY